jgi:hypothetical protein
VAAPKLVAIPRLLALTGSRTADAAMYSLQRSKTGVTRTL